MERSWPLIHWVYLSKRRRTCKMSTTNATARPPRGTAAPVLLKWFVSRDVPTGAPSSNGTIIPIPIPSFPLLVYLHSRKFIRSTDGAKSGVLVRASRPILLPDIIERSSSETRARKALFRFVPVLRWEDRALLRRPHASSSFAQHLLPICPFLPPTDAGMTSALIWQVSSGSSESGNATSLPALESSSSSESLATFRAELINMNLESGWLIAASLSWRLSSRGGACYCTTCLSALADFSIA
ncbi:cytochrome c biogenesis FC, mitochondrion (mitochondrion) [Artemisia annua]|uniref:Cytochrome c biogenesis FC, mitochondrion n=1 Tax=Artemisia annua TaxID=35608 RepID=A0A2U1MH14_ARTAN|nr:cytochrome c biogenesis FC, mitochondrion [Artemisia annua]